MKLKQIYFQTLSAIVFCAALISAPAFSESQAVQKLEKKENVTYQSMEEPSSTESRQNLVAGLGAHYGFVFGTVPALGIDGHYYLTPDWQIGISYAAANYDYKDSVPDEPGIIVDKAQITGSLLLLETRYFIGNSFNISGGLGQRTLGIDVTLRDSVTAATVAGNLKTTSYVAELRIGNNWQWKNGFFLGADWIGINVPFAGSYSGELKVNGTVVSSRLSTTKKEMEDIAEDIARLPMFQLPVFNIGYTF